MTIVGTLRRLSIEGGVWILVADDGRRFQLQPAPQSEREGARVELEGDPKPQGVSFQMAAPIFEVRRLRRVE